MMKKSIIVCIVLIAGAFLITGCALTEPIFERKAPGQEWKRENHDQEVFSYRMNALGWC